MAEFNDKRRSLRVQLRRDSQLSTVDGDYQAHLVNLSKYGALIAILDPHQFTVGEAISLSIALEKGVTVRMSGRVAHVKAHLVGLDCEPMSDEDAARVAAAVDELANGQDGPTDD